MDPKRWEQVKSIVAEADDLAADQRQAFVDQACVGDEELRQEVESLLAADTAGIIDRPLIDFEQPEAESMPDTLVPGTVLGPYRLVRELGRGGLGVVYLAERADQEYEQQVAIKVLKRGLDTDEIVRRFRAERQILANLDHPNIATIHDGGTTDDGRPYFVMEYIEGQPVDRHCDAQGLGVTDRLQLFREVCTAVHYAHRNLVVHRDLKPGNILVARDGEPKLLDFGIAKLLDPEASSGTTISLRPMMTPEYASPEQVKGERITTGSDVYSLGVVLYKLLTGRRPYRIKQRLDAEIRRVICEEEPEKPSTAVSGPQEIVSPVDDSGEQSDPEQVARTRDGDPRKLRRLLEGDVDKIVLMALRKESEDRYSSVEQFSADIERHLQGLPVIAQNPTFLYRARKFVRRNRLGIGIAAAFAVLIIGFAVTMFFQQQEIARERDRAEKTAQFLVNLFEASNPSETGERDLTAREILERGTQKIATDLEHDPILHAILTKTVAEAYLGLGLYREAVSLLENAHSILEIHEPEGLEFSVVCQTLAFAYSRVGKYKLAEPLYLQTLEIKRRHLGKRHRDVATALNHIGVFFKQQARYSEAEHAYKESLQIRQDLLGPVHLDIATSLNNLAALYRATGKRAESRELYLQALEMKKEILGAEHPKVATTLSNLGRLSKDLGEYAQAERYYQEAIRIREISLGPDHPLVAQTLNNLGVLYYSHGRYVEAEEVWARATEIRRSRLDSDDPALAESLHNLGVLRVKQNKVGLAISLLEEALKIYESSHGPHHPKNASTCDALGRALLLLGELSRAEELISRGLEIRETATGRESSQYASSLLSFAELNFQQGRVGHAEGIYLESLKIAEGALGSNHPMIIRFLEGISDFYMDTGQEAKGRRFRERADRIIENR